MASKEDQMRTKQGDAFIEARGLTLKTPLGTPFENINLSVPRGSIVAIVGEHGSGKTPLLLTLAGRMKFTSGSLKIAGYNLPKGRRHVVRQVGMSIFDGINDIEWHLPCRSIMQAELEVWGKPHSKQDVIEYFRKWNLTSIMDVTVSKLSQIDYYRFGIALGMVNNPPMLVVDNIESKMSTEDSHDLFKELRVLAYDYNIVVVVAVTEPSSAQQADFIVKLERGESDGL